MHHCLSKSEVEELIGSRVDGRVLDDVLLLAKIEGAENWDDELSVLNYLFAQVARKRDRFGRDCENLVKALYSLPEQMWIEIQEFDGNFIEYMIKNVTLMTEMTLEEKLVCLQHDLKQHKYQNQVRS